MNVPVVAAPSFIVWPNKAASSGWGPIWSDMTHTGGSLATKANNNTGAGGDRRLW